MELPSLSTLPARVGPLSKLVWKQGGLSKAPRHQWWGYDLLDLQVIGHLSCEHSPHPTRTLGHRSKDGHGDGREGQVPSLWYSPCPISIVE